jgi:hypothetical protein
MNGGDLIELLLTTAAQLAAGWIKADECDRGALEARVQAALAALHVDGDATATAHEARTRATDEALLAATQRRAARASRP